MHVYLCVLVCVCEPLSLGSLVLVALTKSKRAIRLSCAVGVEVSNSLRSVYSVWMSVYVRSYVSPFVLHEKHIQDTYLGERHVRTQILIVSIFTVLFIQLKI